MSTDIGCCLLTSRCIRVAWKEHRSNGGTIRIAPRLSTAGPASRAGGHAAVTLTRGDIGADGRGDGQPEGRGRLARGGVGRGGRVEVVRLDVRTGGWTAVAPGGGGEVRSGRRGEVRSGGPGEVARERAGEYDDGPGSPDGVAAGEVDGGPAEAVRSAGGVGVAVGQLVEVEPGSLSAEELSEVLRLTQRALDRLTGFRTRCVGERERRALAAARPGRENQALRDSRDETARELRLTPSETKRAGETGRRLAGSPAATGALTDGDLPADHARILADTLRWLSGEGREVAEAQLIAAARTEDARTFGRTARRLLAEVDAEAAQTAQDRRNARRSLRVVQTPDGMTAIHGQGAGLDAEYIHEALHAYRRHDAPGEGRTPEQASFDALVDLCRRALDRGDAPTNRSVRPHLLVTVPEPVVADRDGTGGGVAEAAWTGPLPWTEARRILADAGVSRVLLDPAGLPTRAGKSIRSVPGGLWKLLLVRHQTCAADGCTVPTFWCQVMHLERPYRLKGRLSSTNAAPGCPYHHRLYDRFGWVHTWIDGRPVIHHPDHPPEPRGGEPPGRGGPPPGAKGGGPPGAGEPPSRPDGEGPPGSGEPPSRPDGDGPPGSGEPSRRPSGGGPLRSGELPP
jgi:hypothetical protein